MIRRLFDEMALSHLDAVNRTALTLLQDPNEASDLVQDTYVKALQFSDRYEEKGGGMRPWLMRILRNTLYTQRRGYSRRPTTLNPEVLDAFESRRTGRAEKGGTSEGFHLDWEQIDDRVVVAIRELPTEYRETLLLRAVGGLSYDEIANRQDVPVGTVMSRLHRGRRLLADGLDASPSAETPATLPLAAAGN